MQKSQLTFQGSRAPSASCRRALTKPGHGWTRCPACTSSGPTRTWDKRPTPVLNFGTVLGPDAHLLWLETVSWIISEPVGWLSLGRLLDTSSPRSQTIAYYWQTNPLPSTSVLPVAKALLPRAGSQLKAASGKPSGFCIKLRMAQIWYHCNKIHGYHCQDQDITHAQTFCAWIVGTFA